MSDTGGHQSSDNCRDLCPRLQLFHALVFGAPVLFTSLLLLIFCLLYIKRHQGANIHAMMRGQIFAGRRLDSPSEDFGVSKCFRQQLPIVSFDDKFSAICQETQCAVCLGDYKEGEKIQKLPACGHYFHLQCIDKWLSRSVTCPICRISVLLDDNGRCSVDECSQNDEQCSEQATGYGHRVWEERVVTEVQDQSHLITMESNGGSISDNREVSESSAGGHLVGDPMVNMDRSR